MTVQVKGAKEHREAEWLDEFVGVSKLTVKRHLGS